VTVGIRVDDYVLTRLTGVRRRCTNRWIALCPAHEDTNPSLSLFQTHDRFLMHCWAGCRVTDICAAIGITLAELYLDRYGKPDSVAIRQRRAAQSLEYWRQAEIRRCAEDLRTRDTIIRQIDRAIRDGALAQDEALISLEYEYRGYTELELRFDRLLRNQDTLQMWRQSRAS